MTEQKLAKQKDTQVTDQLANLYQSLPVTEQNYYLAKDQQIYQSMRMVTITLGQVALEVRDHISNAGHRSDLDKADGTTSLTFDNWIKAHGFNKPTIYRYMKIATGYNKLFGSDLPNKEQVLNGYVGLPFKYQEMIANGKVNAEQTDLLVTSTKDYRQSTHFKNLLQELGDQKAVTQKVSSENEQLKQENYQLTQANANVEKSRNEVYAELEKKRDEARHLEMQLEELKHQEPQQVEVPPEDYEENKQQLLEMSRQLQDVNEDLQIAKKQLAEAEDNQYSREDIDDLQGEIDRLNDENKQLREQIDTKKSAVEAKRKAFQRVSEKTSEILTTISKLDIMALYPDVQQLTPKELAKTDLPDLAQWFIDRATQIQTSLLGNDDEKQTTINGEFTESDSDD